MSTPRVSVVLPFFNAAETVGRAIASIRAQTFPHWQLLALDDGSEDDGLAAARAAAEDDSRIRVVRAPHAGIVAALQQACAVTQPSEYIARMDADDIAMPGRLAAQTALMDAHPEIGLCGCQVRAAGPAGPGLRRYTNWLNRATEPEHIERDLFIECPVPHPTFFLRRAAFDAADGYQDHGWPEDYCLVMRLRNAGYPLAKVARPLLEWTHRPGRLSMTDPRYAESAFRALKRHYLFEGPLKMRPTFHQWGAGEVGKRWLREWGDRAPAAVVDINPRKVGRTIHGVAVIPPEDLPPPGHGYTLVAVGAPGARAEIRAWFTQRGYHELRDYRFIA